MSHGQPELSDLHVPTDTSIQPEAAEKGWFQRLCPCLHYTAMAPYFDVNTKDIKARLLASLMPFNQKFQVEYQRKPDLYGPFWLLCTLVVVLTISGNLSRYLEFEDPADFTYTFGIVPTSISVLFGIVIFVPLGIRLAIKLFGYAEPKVPLIHGIGIYSYSFSSFLVASLLCGAIPVEWVQWLLIIYSASTSIMFVISVYWAELSSTLESRRRAIVVGVICMVQVALLLIFKLYFFKHVSAVAK